MFHFIQLERKKVEKMLLTTYKKRHFGETPTTARVVAWNQPRRQLHEFGGPSSALVHAYVA